jgi:TrkA domain protein
MSKIEETKLPGVGVRFDFVTEEGQRVGVVHHRGGRREVFVCTVEDPDTAAVTLELDDDDAHTLAEILGVSPVVEAMSQIQQVEGLAIDWLPVHSNTPYGGKTIGDARIRTRTGVSVVVGTAEGIEAVKTILASG